MNTKTFSRPLDLKQVTITDAFWNREQELVRKEVIPYQWEALNDRIADAAPSYCMHNFRAAGHMMREKREMGKAYMAPKYTFRGLIHFQRIPQSQNLTSFMVLYFRTVILVSGLRLWHIL